jgi:DNA-directed RNA polymerase specialized sigma24 family protein
MTRNEYGQAYQSGYDRTVRFLISRGAQRDGAQEAAQAAWVRGWERLSQLRNQEMVLMWVNTIALNAYRRLLRREALMLPLLETSSNFNFDAAAIDVARVLKLCQPKEGALLEQTIRGISVGEIARAEGVTETAIRIRLMRARRAARCRIERRMSQVARADAA